MPRTRIGQGRGESAGRFARVAPPRRRFRPGDRPGRPRQQPADPRRSPRRRRGDAPEDQAAAGRDRSWPHGSKWARLGPATTGEQPRRPPGRGSSTEPWEQASRFLGISAGEHAPARHGGRRALAAHADRRIHPGRVWKGPGSSPAPGRQADIAPQGHARSARTSAHAGRNQSVLGGRFRPRRLLAWSTACWRRRSMASAGAGIGSTWPAMPTATAWTTTSLTPMPGATGITSSPPSTPTSRSTVFSKNNSPATCSPRTTQSTATSSSIATGFLALGPKMLAEDDPVKQQMDIVDEQLDTTCRVFLGLTMGCARCHDHKFDPLSMSDYYALAGIFKSTRTMLTLPGRFEMECRRPWAAQKRPCGWRTSSRSSIVTTTRWSTATQTHVGRRAGGPHQTAGRRQGRIRHDPQSHRGRRRERGGPAGLSAGQSSDARAARRRAGFPRSWPARSTRFAPRQQRPAGTGALAGQSAEPAYGPRARQSGLALAFRPGTGPLGRQFRQARSASRPIPSCSTGWRINWSPMVGR